MTTRENEPSVSQPESPAEHLAGKLELFLKKKLAISVQRYDLPGDRLSLLVPLPEETPQTGFHLFLRPNLTSLEQSYLYLHTIAHAINGDLNTLPLVESPVRLRGAFDSAHHKALELTEKLVEGMDARELVKLSQCLSDRINPDHNGTSMLQTRGILNLLKDPSTQEVKPHLLERIKKELQYG